MRLWVLMAVLWFTVTAVTVTTLVTSMPQVVAWVGILIAATAECITYVKGWDASTEL